MTIKKPSKRIALLLDGDYLVFSAMSAAETEVQWDEEGDIWTLECDHKKARAILHGTIKSIKSRLKEFNEAELVMIFSGANNWRKEVLATYKANRKGKRKPVGYLDFVQSCMDDTESYMKTIQWEGLEGDDIIGILATHPEYLGVDEAIPVSCDKDFNTIPGRFYWLTQDKVVTNSVRDADLYHFYQALKGDTTDGYGGVPGVGEQIEGIPVIEWLQDPCYFYQAIKVMKSGARKGQEVPFWTSCPAAEVSREVDPSAPDVAPLWNCLVSLATKQGMTEQDLIVQAQVSRILRSSDFNWETMKPIPWLPSVPNALDVF
jgi:hypothetical protein